MEENDLGSIDDMKKKLHERTQKILKKKLGERPLSELLGDLTDKLSAADMEAIVDVIPLVVRTVCDMKHALEVNDEDA